MSALTPVLMPWPHLSTAARGLRGGGVSGDYLSDLDYQYLLATQAYKILKSGERTKWRPALMWQGCNGALLFWIGELARQRRAEGLTVRTADRYWLDAYRAGEMAVGPLPWWLGDTGFHLRCQSALLAGDPTYYAGRFVHAPIDLAYLWPTEKEFEWTL